MDASRRPPVVRAAPTAELEPLKDGAVEQTDEHDMGMSYDVSCVVLMVLTCAPVLFRCGAAVADCYLRHCAWSAACLPLWPVARRHADSTCAPTCLPACLPACPLLCRSWASTGACARSAAAARSACSGAACWWLLPTALLCSQSPQSNSCAVLPDESTCPVFAALS